MRRAVYTLLATMLIMVALNVPTVHASDWRYNHNTVVNFNHRTFSVQCLRGQWKRVRPHRQAACVTVRRIVFNDGCVWVDGWGGRYVWADIRPMRHGAEYVVTKTYRRWWMGKSCLHG